MKCKDGRCRAVHEGEENNPNCCYCGEPIITNKQELIAYKRMHTAARKAKDLYNKIFELQTQFDSNHQSLSAETKRQLGLTINDAEYDWGNYIA